MDVFKYGFLFYISSINIEVLVELSNLDRQSNLSVLDSLIKTLDSNETLSDQICISNLGNSINQDSY